MFHQGYKAFISLRHTTLQYYASWYSALLSWSPCNCQVAVFTFLSLFTDSFRPDSEDEDWIWLRKVYVTEIKVSMWLWPLTNRKCHHFIILILLEIFFLLIITVIWKKKYHPDDSWNVTLTKMEWMDDPKTHHVTITEA